MKQCKRCNTNKSTVYESRIIDGVVNRRRQCIDCSFKWKTVEVEYWEWMNGR